MRRCAIVVFLSAACVALLAVASVAQPKINLGIKSGVKVAAMTGDALRVWVSTLRHGCQ